VTSDPSLEWSRVKAKFKGVGLYSNPKLPREKEFRAEYDRLKREFKTLRLPRLGLKKPEMKAVNVNLPVRSTPISPSVIPEDVLLAFITKAAKTFLSSWIKS